MAINAVKCPSIDQKHGTNSIFCASSLWKFRPKNFWCALFLVLWKEKCLQCKARILFLTFSLVHFSRLMSTSSLRSTSSQSWCSLIFTRSSCRRSTCLQITSRFSSTKSSGESNTFIQPKSCTGTSSPETFSSTPTACSKFVTSAWQGKWQSLASLVFGNSIKRMPLLPLRFWPWIFVPELKTVRGSYGSAKTYYNAKCVAIHHRF